MNKILKLGGILVCGILLAVSGLFLVYGLPTEYMREHVQETIDVFMEEGENPFLIENYKGSSLDNFTDAIMLGSAVYDDDEPFWSNAMKVPRAAGVQGKPMESLEQYLHDGNTTEKSEYARYWHGYLLVLKPLLLFLNYMQIRILNGCLQIGLLIWICFEFVRRKLKRSMVSFVIAVLGMFPVVFPCSLQFSNVFYVGNIAVLLILRKHEKWMQEEKYLPFFLIIGMCTSFFDLLTYPLYTFGMPIILYIVLTQGTELRERFFFILKNGIAWMTGYVFMWMGKWLAGSLITGENLWINALETVTVRVSGEVYGDDPWRITSVLRNGYIFFNKAGIFMIIILAVWIGVCVWKSHGEIDRDSAALLGLIACLPIVWYLAAFNHSYAHYWYTFRLLAVSIFAAAMITECMPGKAKGL